MDVVLDDRLLIEELLVGLDRRGARLHTTMYWYYRACRAAVAGAGGHLSGPFRELSELDQQRAIASILRLPEDIGLPEARQVMPLMVDIAGRHPRLNLLNLEAAATARLLQATVWLSPEGSAGVLPDVLREEQVTWETLTRLEVQPADRAYELGRGGLEPAARALLAWRSGSTELCR